MENQNIDTQSTNTEPLEVTAAPVREIVEERLAIEPKKPNFFTRMWRGIIKWANSTGSHDWYQ